ncbi:MAG TPA: type II toxin-antitoxin system HicB family antitoxin, partial [Tepidiformaceae bacterium]|nr:type II toxin-antitoxin system HicB family antitoxin [Tepidiformaceae bacterium]
YHVRMSNEFTAIIEDGGDGWYWAHSPEVPGANGQGRTPPEALDDLAAAIELVLAHLRDEAARSMSPSAVRDVVRVG